MGVYFSNTQLTQNASNRFEVSKIVYQSAGTMGCRNAGKVSGDTVYPFEDASINWRGANWDTTNTRFTAPLRGWYAIYVWVMTDNDAVYGYAGGALRKNGSYIQRCWCSTTGAYHHALPGFSVQYLNQNDYIDFYLFDGEMYGSNQRYCRLMAWKLGR